MYLLLGTSYWYEIGWERGTNEEEQKCVRNFGNEISRGQRVLRSIYIYILEDNTKINFRENGRQSVD
jgi:hypothetical protein